MSTDDEETPQLGLVSVGVDMTPSYRESSFQNRKQTFSYVSRSLLVGLSLGIGCQHHPEPGADPSRPLASMTQDHVSFFFLFPSSISDIFRPLRISATRRGLTF